jgi:hypothetical protein
MAMLLFAGPHKAVADKELGAQNKKDDDALEGQGN